MYFVFCFSGIVEYLKKYEALAPVEDNLRGYVVGVSVPAAAANFINMCDSYPPRDAARGDTFVDMRDYVPAINPSHRRAPGTAPASSNQRYASGAKQTGNTRQYGPPKGAKGGKGANKGKGGGKGTYGAKGSKSGNQSHGADGKGGKKSRN